MSLSLLSRNSLPTTNTHTPQQTLSDGQKSRIVFAMLGMKNYNLLLLDEPTNHLVGDFLESSLEGLCPVAPLCSLLTHS